MDVSSELLYNPKPKTTTALIVIIAHDKTSGSVLVTWESSDLTTWHKLTNERAVIYPRGAHSGPTDALQLTGSLWVIIEGYSPGNEVSTN